MYRGVVMPATKSCYFSSYNFAVTLHGGPVVLRPVRDLVFMYSKKNTYSGTDAY